MLQVEYLQNFGTPSLALEGDSPTVSVLISAITVLAKSFEGEIDISRYVAIHSK